MDHYSNIKEYIISLLKYIPDEDKLSFWREVNQDVVDLIVEAERMNTNIPYIFYDVHHNFRDT